MPLPYDNPGDFAVPGKLPVGYYKEGGRRNPGPGAGTAPGVTRIASSSGDWNHDAPEAEHWMQGVLAPDPSMLRLGAKFSADPVYGHA
jgi:hypothetical protein